MAFGMLRQHQMYSDCLKKKTWAAIQWGQGQIVTFRQEEPGMCVSELGVTGSTHPVESS